MNVFVGSEINQLITRNLQNKHLHHANADGDDIDFITRKKRVKLHLLMKTSLLSQEKN